MLATLVLAAIAAALVVITTRMVITRAGQLAKVQEQIIALVNQKASEATERAGVLEKQAEEERLARVRIEASVGWRRLTEKQKADIGTSFKRFSNQGVSFWSNAGDVEAQLFAADIAEAATRAETLRVYAPAQVLRMMEGGAANLGKPIKRIDTGVVIVYTDDVPSHELADAISMLLVDCGFDAISRKNEPPPKPIAPQVWVNVESRPQGAQGEYKLKAHKTPQ
jgi:hypothetical protein